MSKNWDIFFIIQNILDIHINMKKDLPFKLMKLFSLIKFR